MRRCKWIPSTRVHSGGNLAIAGETDNQTAQMNPNTDLKKKLKNLLEESTPLMLLIGTKVVDADGFSIN